MDNFESYPPIDSNIGLKPRMSIDFALENVSKENRPWYLPIPEAPTPPKGSVSTD